MSLILKFIKIDKNKLRVSDRKSKIDLGLGERLLNAFAWLRVGVLWT
jgi:hypothetical protein